MTNAWNPSSEACKFHGFYVLIGGALRRHKPPALPALAAAADETPPSRTPKKHGRPRSANPAHLLKKGSGFRETVRGRDDESHAGSLAVGGSSVGGVGGSGHESVSTIPTVVSPRRRGSEAEKDASQKSPRRERQQQRPQAGSGGGDGGRGGGRGGVGAGGERLTQSGGGSETEQTLFAIRAFQPFSGAGEACVRGKEGVRDGGGGVPPSPPSVHASNSSSPLRRRVA